MLKRTLIAIAVVALLATSVQALGPAPHTPFVTKDDDGNVTATDVLGKGKIKVNMGSFDLGWPVEYKALDLCTIPIVMNVGYFVEVKKCNERKIRLVQVNCDDMKKGKDWPCYSDCENVEVRANFEAKLGLKLIHKSGPIKEWGAYFKVNDEPLNSATIYAATGWQKVVVCVEAWKAKLYGTTPGTKIKVGSVVITVKPNV